MPKFGEKKQNGAKTMNVEMWPVERLRPYVNNPRKNDKAVKKVAESIQKFGFNVPITVDKDGVIATGHTRLKAAILLGMTEVPVIVLADLNEEQINAWRLVDNKTSEIAEWDFDKLAEELKKIKEIDLSSFDFKVEDPAGGLHEDDYKGTLPKKPKSKLGDIYILGPHRVMCGDATNQDDVLKLVGDTIVDLWVTDPPYNVNYGGRGKQYKEKGGYECGMDDRTILNDSMDEGRFLAFLEDSFGLARDVLKPGGAFYIFHSDSHGSTFRNAVESQGLTVRQCIIWVKNSLVLGRQDYQWIHEPCLYGWKDGAGHYFINDRGFTTVITFDKEDLNKLSKPELVKIIKQLQAPKESVSVIEEDKPARNDLHPTMKPIRLVGRLIANSSKVGECVLDTFGGSGSTLIAAEQLGRKCYMMEKDPKYVDVIVDRWEAYTGQKAVKENQQ